MYPRISDEQFIIETIRRLRHKSGPLPGGIGAHEGCRFSSLTSVLCREKMMSDKDLIRATNNLLRDGKVVITGRHKYQEIGIWEKEIACGIITTINTHYKLNKNQPLYLNMTSGVIQPKFGYDKGYYKLLRPDVKKITFQTIIHSMIYVTEDILPINAQKLTEKVIYPFDH